MEVHYIWVAYFTPAGSICDKLAYNGKTSLANAKKAIDTTTKEQYLAYCTSKFFSTNCIKIEITAQNVHTGERLYKRIINIH